MISFRNYIIRTGLQFIFKLASFFITIDDFLRRRRKEPFLLGEPSGYEGQKERLEQVFLQMKEPKYLAQTSGTRNTPKLVPYDLGRTRLVQKTFFKSMVTLTSSYRGHKTFFVFSSLGKDHSLTSGLLESDGGPGLVALLQAPYRYLLTPSGQELRALVGDLTSRVALLVVSRPRFFYATNPSTITHFLDEYESRWSEVRRGIEKILSRKEVLKRLLALADGNGEQRLVEASRMASPPSIIHLVPELKGMICWDGGYVSVFLEQLKKKAPHVDHIPMFSMSTEALETLPHRVGGKVHFLPTAPYTYAEFMDDSGCIIGPRDVEVGESYTLLVSDKWGLVRYDTQDIFRVKEIVDGLPDLQFIKRRGITSSLTGEKITEEQVLALSSQLKEEFPWTMDAFYSLYPTERNGSFGYQLAIVGGRAGEESEASLSARAETIFCEINSEYASKVESGRLQKMNVQCCSAAELAALMGNKENWESQFKILSLYEKIVRAD